MGCDFLKKTSRNIVIVIIIIFLLSSIDLDSSDNDSSMNNENKVADETKQIESKINDDTNVNMEDNAEEVKIIENKYKLDIANNKELITDLISEIDYEKALAEYKKYYSSEDIIKIQEKLQNSEINCGEVDGVIGHKTIASIVHFQKIYKTSVTGVVDSNTASGLKLTYKYFDAYEKKNTKNIKIQLTNRYLNYNNHVGHDWGTAIEVGEINLKSKSAKIALKSDDEILIRASATEFDSISDYGSKSLKLSYKDLERGESYKYALSVIVRENRGRYSGNTAEWIFNIKVTVN